MSPEVPEIKALTEQEILDRDAYEAMTNAFLLNDEYQKTIDKISHLGVMSWSTLEGEGIDKTLARIRTRQKDIKDDMNKCNEKLISSSGYEVKVDLPTYIGPARVVFVSPGDRPRRLNAKAFITIGDNITQLDLILENMGDDQPEILAYPAEPAAE